MTVKYLQLHKMHTCIVEQHRPVDEVTYRWTDTESDDGIEANQGREQALLVCMCFVLHLQFVISVFVRDRIYA